MLALASLCVAGFTSAPPALMISPAAGAGFACVVLLPALHQAVRHRETRRKLAKSVHELRIAQEAGSTLALPELLGRVCRTTMDAVSCDRVAIYLWSERYDAFIPAADLGTPAHVAARLGAPRYRPDAIQETLRDGEPLVLSRDEPDDTDVLVEAELHELVVVPLPARGRPLGCLMLGYHAPPGIDAATFDMACGIARQAASSIEHARLFAKAENAARFRAQLAQLATSMHSQRDPAALGALLSSRGAALFGVDVGAVFTRQGDRLVAVATAGSPTPSELFEVPIDDVPAPVTSAFANNRPVFVNDVAASRLSADPTVRALGIASLLVVPLIGQGGPIGCLVYGDRTKRYPYSPAIADEGMFLGEMVTAAFERARYAEVEEARRHAERHAAGLARHAAVLARARNAAVDAAQSKAAFLANMSHEIRTPMTAILGYVRLLSDGRKSDEERADYLETIRRNGEHLLRILNDVLDLSKIDAGRMTIERTACSPTELVEDVASLMRARAQEKGLEFTMAYDGLIPERIHADPTRLRQVLINVVGNAVKFTENGGIRIEVGMLSDAGTTLRIAVVDTGCGIPGEAQAKLFDVFSQADVSTTRTFGGTGLGLAISKRLARMLGGDITVDSAIGLGSTFTITVDTGPLDGIGMIDHVDGVVMRRPAQPLEVPRFKGGVRVLLVEDALDNQKLLALYLREAGATVEVAGDGVTACEKAMVAAPYDVILMDVQMPRLDGHHAAARLRSQGYGGVIVALTAHAMAGERANCLAAGCDDFLAKPVEPEALIQTIAKHVGTRNPAAVEAGAPLVSRLAGLPAFDQLLREFVQELPARVAAMEADLRTDDVTALATRAHQLKGTAGTYGFPALTEAARALETGIAAGLAAAEIESRLRRLEEVCRRVRASTRTAVDHAA